MSEQSLYRRTLKRALETAGGQTALQARIKVPENRLAAWLQGSQPIPEDIFLRLVDVVVSEPAMPPAAPDTIKPANRSA